MNSTITLQSIVNLASTHVELVPLSGVGGYQNEPALSLCNDALSELLASPNDWKFNRVEMPMFVTSGRKQDYLFAGAAAFTLGGTSAGVGIDLTSNHGIAESGNAVTVKTLEPHTFNVNDVVYMVGNTVTAYNSALSITSESSTWTNGWVITAKTPTSFSFTHATAGLPESGAPGITDFGWLSSASMIEMNNTSYPQNTRYLEAVREIQPASRVANPEKVCVLKDYATGVLKFRFQYVPGSTIWGVNLVYQAAAPLKTALSNTWSPVPDHYAFVLRQAFLWSAYRYLGSPRADVEYQKLQQKVLRAMGASDRESSDVHVYPETALLDWGLYADGF